jgi:hypothetical protein
MGKALIDRRSAVAPVDLSPSERKRAAEYWIGELTHDAILQLSHLSHNSCILAPDREVRAAFDKG